MKKILVYIIVALLTLPLLARASKSITQQVKVNKLKNQPHGRRTIDVPSEDENSQKLKRDFLFEVNRLGLGTNSGGGGNFINSKPIESYIFNYKNSPEFALVRKKIDVIKKYMPSVYLDLQVVLRNKIWYKIPNMIETLPGYVIGVPGATGQGAIQTLTGIWISSPIYDKGSVEDKALLQMHEILLGLRYYQLNSEYTFCQTYAAARGKDSCNGFESKPLKLQDYDQIRNAASELMALKNPTGQQVLEVMYFNSFDIGNANIIKVADSFKNLDLSSVKNLLTKFINQGTAPTTGQVAIIDGRLINNARVRLSLIDNLSDFNLTVDIPDLHPKTYRGFSNLLYIDDSVEKNSIYYMLQTDKEHAHLGDISATVILKFRGLSLVGISISEEILRTNLATNKNEWVRTQVDSDGNPSLVIVLGEM